MYKQFAKVITSQPINVFWPKTFGDTVYQIWTNLFFETEIHGTALENRDNVGFRPKTPELTVPFCYLFIMIENGVFDCLSRKLSMLINELVAMQVACLMDF